MCLYRAISSEATKVMERVEQQRQELHAVIFMLVQSQSQLLATGPAKSPEASQSCLCMRAHNDMEITCYL